MVVILVGQKSYLVGFEYGFNKELRSNRLNFLKKRVVLRLKKMRRIVLLKNIFKEWVFIKDCIGRSMFYNHLKERARSW